MKKVIDRNLLKKVCVFVTAFMLLAHMYVFTNGAILFDAVGVYRGKANFLIGSDKWAGAFYWWMDLGVNCPWLAGVWATVLMILTVYCICDILEIHTVWGIMLTSGLCAVNTTIICEQEYTGQNFYIIIPLLQAVLAAWIIRKSNLNSGLKVLLSVFLVALSGGTYGSMVSMMPAILLMAVILDIFKGKAGKENWMEAVQYAGIFLCGMALYYIILRSLLHIQGGEIQSYMGESALSNTSVLRSMVRMIPEAYKNMKDYYMGRSIFLPSLLNKALLALMIFGIIESLALLVAVRKQLRDKLLNGVLLIVAIVISPAVLNLIYIMALGNVHYLMIFTYSMPLITFVRINEIWMENGGGAYARYTGYISRALCVFFIYYSVVMSNAVYIHYQQMYIETISIGTRILDRIETCKGFEGTEDIILLGSMQYNEYWGIPGEENAMILDAFLGPGNPQNINGFNYGSIMRRFLINVLGSRLMYICYGSVEECAYKENLSVNEIDALMEMPLFPAYGSVEKIGEKIYVKLSESE